MADDYANTVVRLAVAQICKSLGWDAIQSSSYEVMVDFMERHIQMVGNQTRRYAEQFGCADGSLDDLSMAFKELQVDQSELLDYMKNVEPIKLPQSVTQLEVPAQNKLIYPQLSESDGVDSSSVADASTGSHLQVPSLGGITDSPSANNSKLATASPARTPSRHRLPVGIENQKFRMRSHLMMENGELSTLFNKGTLPSSAAPPQPPPEMRIPKIRNESISHKPKLKTGAFKPMRREPTPPPLPEPVIEEIEPVEIIPVIEEPVKPKPPSKKKKKKHHAAAPEGFQDIFGATLEKPKSSKPSIGRQCSVSLEKLEVLGPTAPEPPSVSPRAVEDTEDYVDDSDPAIQRRLLRIDDTINKILIDTRAEIQKADKAEQAFSFSDRPETPVDFKSRVKAQASRSNVDETIDAVLRGEDELSMSFEQTESDLNDIEPLDVSPLPPNEPKVKSRDKEKKKKKSKREKLLEQFAAAPLECFTSGSQELDEYKSPADSVTHPSVDYYDDHSNDVPSIESQTQIFSETVQPLQVGDMDDEECIVNVDGEDSDVDILEMSSPVPPPDQTVYPNVVAEAPATPGLTGHDESMDQSGDQDLLQETATQHGVIASEEVEVLDWDMNQASAHGYEPNEHVIDFSQHTEKKEKHKKGKKEKKEKKEKKKKKHKEKDKDREDKSHKHKEKSPHSTIAVEEDMDEQVDGFPKLTLKIGGHSEVEGIPKLVIKPFGLDSGTPYVEESYLSASQSTSATDTAGLSSVTMEPNDEKLWICPGCSKPDDGSLMIGCDSCDEWYHWVCVGVVSQPAEDAEWFCPRCSKKPSEKNKKKKKKKHRHD